MDFKRVIFDKFLIFMVAIILICSFSTNAVAADLLTPEDLGQIIKERIIKGTRELAKNS